MNTIIVDDEPFSQKGLASYLSRIEYVALAGCCENAFEAREMLATQQIDLMLLDIEMPELSGMQLLKTLHQKPITIIISAYPEYALEGFELDVIDYLIKPVGFERFQKAVQKSFEFFRLRKNVSARPPAEYLFVKCNKQLEKIHIADIFFVEALHNYVAIHTTHSRFITYQTLKNIEQLLHGADFLKIQKSYIVSISKIESIKDGKIKIKDSWIPFSRSIKSTILERITHNNKDLY